MEIITQAIYSEQQHAFLFPVRVLEPVHILVKELRSEEVYETDQNAAITAFSAIAQASAYLSGRLYAVIAQAEIAPVKKLRSYKGILQSASSLKQMEHHELEVLTGDGTSRLGVVVALEEKLNSEKDVSLILNYMQGVLLATDHGIDDVCALAKNWMQGAGSRYPSLDFDAIMASLEKDRQLNVLRYFPADNGRSERLILAANSKSGMANALKFFAHLNI